MERGVRCDNFQRSRSRAGARSAALLVGATSGLLGNVWRGHIFSRFAQVLTVRLHWVCALPCCEPACAAAARQSDARPLLQSAPADSAAVAQQALADAPGHACAARCAQSRAAGAPSRPGAARAKWL
jgi:hypothetical protein